MLVVLLLASCGDIREVPVADGSAADGSATGDEASTSASSDSATGAGSGETTIDVDSASGTSDGSGDPPLPALDIVCGPLPVAFDETGTAEVLVEVSGFGIVEDLDVGVRLMHDDPTQVELTLVRGASEWTLLAAGDGTSCEGNIEAFFDDQGSAPGDVCTAESLDAEGTVRVRPAQDFSGALAESADGVWSVRATGPAGQSGSLDSVCLAATPAG